MDIEIKVDEKYTESKIVIYTKLVHLILNYLF